MHKLSAQTQELVRRLANRAKLWERLFSSQVARLEIIRSLGGSREPAAIAYLTPFMFSKGELAHEAAQAIDVLIGTCQSDDYVWLDEDVRLYLGWTARARQALPGVSGSRSLRATVAGIVSFHPNGHLRERAVVALADLHDEAAAPFLLIRVNDWVPAVRVAAHAALFWLLDNDKLEGLRQHLSLVVRLLRCGRDRHQALVAAVFDKLWQKDHSALLARLSNHASKEVRREGYRQALRQSETKRQVVIETSFNGLDEVVRLWAVKDAVQYFGSVELEKLLRSAKCDPFPPVRREALAGFLARFPALAETHLKDALLDPSAAVRDYARFYLRDLGWRDFASHYRHALANSGPVPAAVAGLGETGSSSDLPLLGQFSGVESAFVRQLVVRGIGRISGGEGTKALVVALLDQSAKVSREAKRALLSNPRQVSLVDLDESLYSNCPVHVRKATIELLDCLWSWNAVPCLLNLAADRNCEVAAMARRRLLRRINRVFTNPSKSEQNAIIEALQRTEEVGAEEFAKEFGDWFRTRMA